MRVLTFNSHQPYVHLLATALPWHLGVVTPPTPGGSVKGWDERIRPVPPNVRLYPGVTEALRDGEWDWVLTHNVHDLMDAAPARLPKVFLVHGTISGRIVQDRSNVDKKDYLKAVRALLKSHEARVVYISPLKERDWGLPGKVILSSVDLSQYGGYRGETPGVLQVSNHLKERGAILGYATHAAVTRGLPHLVVGHNADIPESRLSESWDDLKEHYRAWRVYLYSAVHPYEDGFNLALLEAMATGMPVAALAHPTSPVRDGSEGIVAENAEDLRGRVAALLEDADRCRELGQAARSRVESRFPLERFRSSWMSLAARL